MNCSEKKCLCEKYCSFMGECALSHPLIQNHSRSVVIELERTTPKDRFKMFIDILQVFQPPKVNRLQINSYYKYKRHGIDIDKEEDLKFTLPRDITRHKHLGKNIAKKKRNKWLRILKTDTSRRIKSVIKDRRRVVAEYLRGNGINPKKLPTEEKILIYTDAALHAEEYRDFLQHQTPEQFELAKKHGWRIAKMLTEPEQNFHHP